MLTTWPYQLPNQLQDSFGVATPPDPADEAASAARLTPSYGSEGNSEPTRAINIRTCIVIVPSK